MPVGDYVNYPYMRRMLAETMLYDAQRLAFSVGYDDFGGEVPVYTPAEVFQCGIKPILVSEQPAFTGVVVNYDTKIRIPYSLFSIFGPRDRIRVMTEESVEDYEIVGPIILSQWSIVIEASRVQ